MILLWSSHSSRNDGYIDSLSTYLGLYHHLLKQLCCNIILAALTALRDSDTALVNILHLGIIIEIQNRHLLSASYIHKLKINTLNNI